MKKKKQNINSMPVQSYAACIKQSGQNHPQKIEYINELGFGDWRREEEGFYTCHSTTPFPIDLTKIYAERVAIGNTANGVMPVHDYSGVVGYVLFGVDPGAPNNCIRYYIESFDPSGNYVDLSKLFFDTNRIYLPKIEAYQP